MNQQPRVPDVTLAELVAALSRAGSLGLGSPIEWSLRVCLLCMYFGAAIGMTSIELSDLYYSVLLRPLVDPGLVVRAISADTIAPSRERSSSGVFWQAAELLHLLWDVLNDREQPKSLPPLVRDVLVIGIAHEERTMATHCVVAQRMARRLGLGSQVIEMLGHVFERWDGRGVPGQLKGEALPLVVRVMQIVTDAELLFRLGGGDSAITVIQYGAGRAYDPALAMHFCHSASQLLPLLSTDSVWQAVLAVAPCRDRKLSHAELDDALLAIAEWIDLCAARAAGHSAAVAVLVTAAGRRYGLPHADIPTLRQAALLHDIGMVGIPASIRAKPAPLSDDERERVRLHPYDTERIFARSHALAPIGALAALHHERLDGSGYYRGLAAPQLSPAARLLAAADVYQSLIEPRPYRRAATPANATDVLLSEVRAGRLESDAVRAVLAAAGHHLAPGMYTSVAGLSAREIEVLRLLARGWSNRRMAEQLVISERTVDHHIRHIYDKIDVSTRAAATLFAMQHHLLDPPGEYS